MSVTESSAVSCLKKSLEAPLFPFPLFFDIDDATFGITGTVLDGSRVLLVIDE